MRTESSLLITLTAGQTRVRTTVRETLELPEQNRDK